MNKKTGITHKTSVYKADTGRERLIRTRARLYA